MNINEQQASDLKNALQQEQQAVAALFSLLQQEQDALRVNKTDVIAELAQQKLQLITEIDRSHKQRMQLLQQFGMPQQATQFETNLTQQSVNVQQLLLPIWQSLKKAIHACSKLNEVNGTAIAVNLHNTARILDIFKGRDISSDLYGADGQLNSQQTSNGSTKV